jgi:PBSX family phage terminase large subunit
MKKTIAPFKFKPFSKKALQILTWWTDTSPVKDYDGIIADGAIRAGKTIPMTLSFCMWSNKRFSDENFAICGKTIGSLRRNVLQPLKKMCVARHYKLIEHRADNMIEISYGPHTNFYYLFGGKDEGSQDLIQGITLAGILFDEVALMPQSFVDQGMARCSVEGSKIWFNCNPESPFHFVKNEYIDKAKEQHFLHLHFTLDDNLSLSEDKKDEYRRRYTGIFYQRFILGLWVIAEGAIYPMFDDALNSYNDSTRPPELEALSRRYIAIDYGTANPCCFLDIFDDNNTIWVDNEYYWNGREDGRKKSDPEYADDLKKFIGHTPEPLRIIIDPSALSLKTMLEQRGYTVTSADNDVSPGISAVASLFYQRKIKVHTRCKNFYREVHSYSWNEKKAQDTGVEAPIKVGDHSQDALRYFVYTVLPKWRIAGE